MTYYRKVHAAGEGGYTMRLYIPKEITEKYGIKAGDTLAITEELTFFRVEKAETRDKEENYEYNKN